LILLLIYAFLMLFSCIFQHVKSICVSFGFKEVISIIMLTHFARELTTFKLKFDKVSISVSKFTESLKMT